MSARQAEQVAERALNVFHAGGLYSYPIDPVTIARSLGINVYTGDYENNVSGMIARMEHHGDINMFINRRDAAVRQRFTTAHELGHYFAILQDPTYDEGPFIHKRDELSACGTDVDEIFANQFAAALLMPAREVKELHAIGMDEFDLASRFHVSHSSMAHRLKNLALA